MRVGIDIVWFAMSGPTGVCNPNITSDILAFRKLLQVLNPAFRLINRKFVLFVYQSNSGTIVTSVFEAMQSFNQNRVSIPISNITNNTTHIKPIYYVFVK